MDKKIWIAIAAAVIIIVIILSIVGVSSDGQEATIGYNFQEYENVTSEKILKISTTKLETSTEIHISTTPEPAEEDVAGGDYVELNMICLKKSGISLDSLQNAAYGNVGDDKATKDFLLCLLKGMGILDRSGNFSINSTKLKLWSQFIKDDNIERFINMCKGKIGETPGDTAVLVYKCMLVTQMISVQVETGGSTKKGTVAEQYMVPKTDEERIRKLKPLAILCMLQSGITPSETRLLKYGVIGENRSSKEFIFCLLRELKIVNEDGEIAKDIDAIAKMWGQNIENDKAENIIAACQGKKAETPADTAVLVYKCMKGIK